MGKKGWYFNELLVHATYISARTRITDGSTGANKELDTNDAWCKTFFEQNSAVTTGPAAAGSLYGGAMYKNQDVKLACIPTILTATKRPIFTKRYYASFIFGCSYDADAQKEASVYKWYCHGGRRFFTATADYPYGYQRADDKNRGALLPNVFATQDSVFRLVQLSGGSLCLGVACHVLAFLLGGFIWNYKDCCDWGVCSFLFNSLVYAYGSLLFYIISACSFAAIYLQGIENEDTNQNVKIKWSVGGILLLCGIFIEIIGLSLASYAFYKDAQQEREREVTQVLKEEGVLREVVPPPMI